MNTHNLSSSDLTFLEEDEQLRALGLRAGRPNRTRNKHQVIMSAEPENDQDSDLLLTTYQPGLYEARWLSESLRGFIEQELIVDVLSTIKGGKEASVYRCVAGPAHGGRLVAAKVYRPQQFRNLRNDALYREGREILDPGKGSVHANDRRSQTALRKKTSFGEKLRHVSWLSHEYDTLKRLHAAGGAVPTPLAASENVILMDLVGDEHVAAPTLHGIRLQPHEVKPLFEEMLRNIRLMLKLEIVHGDLSAYNVLYWQGEVVLIDFPQVVDCYNNRQAYRIFERDMAHLCAYFAAQGLERDPQQLAHQLWHEYIMLPDVDIAAEIEASEQEARRLAGEF